jgi:hypothetical protein
VPGGGDRTVDVRATEEAAHRRQATIDGGRREATVLEADAKQLEVGAGRLEPCEPDISYCWW